MELFDAQIEPLLVDWESAESRLKHTREQARVAEKKRDSALDDIAAKLGSYRRAFTASGWSFAWKETSRAGYAVKPTTVNKFEIKRPKGE